MVSPPAPVAAREADMIICTLGIDIGGSRTAVGVVGLNGSVLIGTPPSRQQPLVPMPLSSARPSLALSGSLLGSWPQCPVDAKSMAEKPCFRNRLCKE